MLGGIVLFYGNQAPPDQSIRMAVIAQAKPVAALPEETQPDELPVIDLASPPAFESTNGNTSLTATTTITGPADLTLTGLDGLALPDADPSLPDEFDLIEPEVELSEEATFTNLVFSTEINDDYDPVSPRRTFVEGFFTIYATFDYVGMADGLAWSWVWRRDGEVINGGNELWQYADDGPGWIFFEPPEGYAPGQYTLDVWVNGELFQRGSFVVESEAANR